MRSIPPSMQAELGEWNGGDGVDLETWISLSGSFQLAVGYAEYFWPEFKLLDDFIIRAGISQESLNQWTATRHDRRSIEATINHMHLIDINYQDQENLTEDILIHLGNLLKEIYEAKLLWQFPDRPCKVSLFIPENPKDLSAYEISFWQIAHETAREC